jgi:hypothetical protein
LAGALAFAVYKIWSRCQDLEKQLAESQAARIADLKSILKQGD